MISELVRPTHRFSRVVYSLVRPAKIFFHASAFTAPVSGKRKEYSTSETSGIAIRNRETT
jgi:hypothetical protein